MLDRHLGKILILAVLALLVLKGLPALLRIGFLPLVVEKQDSIASRISQMLDMDASIEGLSADMHGWTPQIHMARFRLNSRSHEPLMVFDNVDAGLDLLPSIWRGEPSILWLSMEGGSVGIEHHPDGSFRLAGMAPSEDGIPAWLLNAHDIHMHDLHVRLKDLAEKGQEFQAVVDAVVNNDGNRHHAGVHIDSAGMLGKSLMAVLDIEGTPGVTQDWHADYYLKAKDIRPGRWPGLAVWTADVGDTGALSVELWGNRDAESDHHLAGYVSTRELTSRRKTIPDLDSRFYLDMTRSSWDITLQSLQSRQGLRLHYQPDSQIGADDWQIFVPYLDLATYGSIRPLIEQWLPGNPLAQETRELAGHLRDVSLRVTSGMENQALQWEICGAIDDLGWKADKAANGFDHLDVYLCGNQDGGKARLGLDDTRVEAEDLAASLPPVESGGIDLSWTSERNSIYLTASRMQLDFADASFRGRMQLVLPDDFDLSKAYLDTRLDLGSFSLSHLDRYLPHHLIPSTSQWLTHAIRDGWVDHARLLLQGQLANFPFRDGHGVFKVDIHARDVSLNFAEHWKEAEHIDGIVTFDGPAFGFEVTRGFLGHMPVEWVHGQSSDLPRAGSRLDIDGQLQTSLSDATQYLIATPLGKSMETILQFGKPEGDIRQTLTLRIPFDDTQALHYSGQTTLLGGRLKIDAIDEPLTDIRGVISFDEKHLESKGIDARFGHQPLTAKIIQSGDHWLLNADGWWSLGRLSQKRSQALSAFISGSTPFSLQLDAWPDERQNFQSMLKVTSPLTGLKLDLPKPWGKQENEVRDSRVSIRIPTRLDAHYSISADYGTDVHADMLIPPHQTDGQTSIAITLGRKSANTLLREGFQLSGQLESLDADALLEWIERHPVTTPDAGLPEAMWLDMDINHLRFRRQDRQSFHCKLAPDGRGFKGRLESFFGKGQFHIQNGETGIEALDIDLEQLVIPDAVKDGQDSHVSPDPRNMPSITLGSQSLIYHGQDFGRFQLQARHQPGGMAISKLSLQNQDSQFSLQGEWLILDQHEETYLWGKGHMDDMGQWLDQLGLQGVIRESPTDIKGSWRWHAWPLGVSASNLIGDLDMHLGAGALIKVDVGIGRLFGALSVSQIWRRLSLDFSDLWSQGMAYNSIDARFQFDRGLATTQQLLVDGVAANISVTGSANLLDRTLYQEVQVIPDTGIALPVAGLILGGPVGPIVGAAALVAENVFSSQVDAATQTHYVIQGDWDKPSITRIYGNNPADLVGRAWKGIKGLSGMNEEGDNKP
ncbi:MAG: hypothetical protein RIQ52_487 [Pseudomonadota bacterium]